MKNSLSTILRPLIICLFALGNASAAELLAVDFGGAVTPVQAGFVGQSGASATHSTTAGNVTVVIAGQQGIQGLTALTSAVEGYNMYNDGAFKNGGTMTLTLSGPGISANTGYQMTFWSCYYNVQTRTTSFAATAGTTGTTLGPIATAITTPTGFNDPAYSATGTFTSDGSGVLTFSITGSGARPMINGFQIQTVGGADTTPPTLASSNIVDDQGGGPVTTGTLITYTLTFNEDMNASTVDASDFGDAGGDVSITIGAITETSPGVFTVEVTPTTTGTLDFQVNASAILNDAAGNALDTNAAIVDDTSITVNAPPPDTTPPTLASADIVDNQGGGPVLLNSLITYTVTFSEDMDAGTVDASDFGDAGGDVSISIGTIAESSPGVFTVGVTPTTVGSLELQINPGAVLKDISNNSLVTTPTIVDDTSITIIPSDTTPPTLASTGIVDNQGGGPVSTNSLVTYTVTFSEDIDAATVDGTDFGDAGGDVSVTIGTITETSPGVFSVEVTPTTIGALELEVVAAAVITDAAGNALNTTSAITDDTSLTVAAPSSTTLISIDFGAAGAEPGFTQQSSTNTTHSTSAGNLTVDLAGTQGLFNAATTGANDLLYRDFYFKNGGTITLTLSGVGISPSTDYELSFWSYYAAEGRNTTFAPGTGTTGPSLGPIAPSTTPPTGLADPLYTISGTYTSDATGNLTILVSGTNSRPAINALRIATIGPDATPPSILPANIVDDQGGADVEENTLVTYTLTFSEDIDESSVSAADFGNAGSSPVTFGSITEVTPGVFTVAVTPTAAGTLQLQIPIGATILDMAGLSMETAVATLDDTTLNVVVAPPDNTAPTPNPMTFAVVPYASSENSIAMEATTATDAAGVVYYFDETSGNPGGDDSPWQSSPVYEDTGLTTGLTYTYTVTARDLSANQNATLPSAPESATAQTPVIPPVITAPTSRHIVQRTSSNVGTIKIEGTYSVGSPDEIEARAVVMTGTEDNGTTTAWQTIDAAPAGGTFAGSLTNVPAGGWYQLEVRTVINSTPSNAAVLAKVGVGDIYITAGQSNSANFAAGYTLQSDRVSARSSTTNSTWVLGTPPLPISNGTSGSVWPVLGDKLIAAEDVPIGFVSCGIGGSTASSWTIGGGNYNSLLKPAVKSFPVNGFKAALWHQGETDSVNGVSAATHSGYLNGMISQSRIDAGWTIPWYLAEVSFHPSSNITNQEPIAAGQRASIHGDALTFFGPSTDEFHLTGGGSLHFNAVGNEAHAQGWADILTGNVTAAPENGNFEDLGWLAYAVPPTSLTPLADGSATILNIVSGGQQIRVLDWRILAASGVAAADGSNGFHNPSTGTFAGAVDSVNGGVLPNMSGKHVALLDGGSAGNYFLHSTRTPAEQNTLYTLTVALGVRDNPASFGNARLEIAANGAVVASASFDKAALDALHGSDASGTFTNASVSWTTGGSVAANQPLAIRVVKEGGTGTVLDFDNVRLTSVPSNTYSSWIDGFGLDPADKDFNDDPDGDGLANGLEAWFGTHPGQFNAGLADFATNGTTTTFTHARNANPPTDVTGNFYDWCVNLADWYPSGGGPGGGPTVTLVPVTVGTTTSVTATASEPIPTFFLRARATRN